MNLFAAAAIGAFVTALVLLVSRMPGSDMHHPGLAAAGLGLFVFAAAWPLSAYLERTE